MVGLNGVTWASRTVIVALASTTLLCGCAGADPGRRSVAPGVPSVSAAAPTVPTGETPTRYVSPTEPADNAPTAAPTPTVPARAPDATPTPAVTRGPTPSAGPTPTRVTIEASSPPATPVLPYTYVPATPRPYTYLPAGPGPLRVDGFARVLVDDLVVRSEPSVGASSAIVTPHLAADDRLFVLDGPVPGSGYAWYQVRAMPPDDSSARPSGWVAAASREGVPWIEGLTVACPSGAPNIAVLATLAAEERRACYGDAEITFAAWDCGVAFVDGPDPSDGSVPVRTFLVFGPRTCRPGMEAIGAAELVGTYAGVGDRYRLTGHFSASFFIITSWELIDVP